MAWFALIAALLIAPAHPNSFSASRLLVHGSAVRLELHCQTLSLLEVVAADDDGDGLLDPEELAAHRQAIGDYVLGHYLLAAAPPEQLGLAADEAGAWQLLDGRLVELSTAAVEPSALLLEQWVDLAFEFDAPFVVGDLRIDITLFNATSPDHRDLCTLSYNDEPPIETLFDAIDSRRVFRAEDPPSPRPLLGWIELGVDHILSGWDHLAFVLALIVASRGLASLLGVVTAFTLAHSITLALAALDVVSVPGRPVELAIAASIVWLGAANLFARQPRSRWPEAFVFGLVHGLGFAGFLAAALHGEPRRLPALFGFNVGVEVGQVLVVLAVVTLLAALRPLMRARGGDAPDAPVWLAPRPVRVLVSLAVLGGGLYWTLARVGGI